MVITIPSTPLPTLCCAHIIVLRLHKRMCHESSSIVRLCDRYALHYLLGHCINTVSSAKFHNKIDILSII